jgi:pimeloyl-ACP methyl ester carboxylesterase
VAEAARTFVRTFGQPGGSPVLYFHGTPGAPEEAELIATAARDQGLELWAVDRLRIAAGTRGAAYLDAVAQQIRGLSGGHRLPIVGFSIGAALALRIAARIGRDAGPLFLLSTAGPLDLPGAFDGMGAGARVFRSARANGAGFALAAFGQALLARRAPAVMTRLLFAGADAADRAFARSTCGRALLPRLYARAWADGGRSYQRDLLAYVEDWSGELAGVTSAAELWHGSGDTWAPIGMADGVAARLAAARLHTGSGGHYSTLIHQGPAALASARLTFAGPRATD